MYGSCEGVAFGSAEDRVGAKDLDRFPWECHNKARTHNIQTLIGSASLTEFLSHSSDFIFFFEGIHLGEA